MKLNLTNIEEKTMSHITNSVTSTSESIKIIKMIATYFCNIFNDPQAQPYLLALILWKSLTDNKNIIDIDDDHSFYSIYKKINKHEEKKKDKTIPVDKLIAKAFEDIEKDYGEKIKDIKDVLSRLSAHLLPGKNDILFNLLKEKYPDLNETELRHKKEEALIVIIDGLYQENKKGSVKRNILFDHKKLPLYFDAFCSHFYQINHDAATMPKGISDLIAALLEPRDNDDICDPSCDCGTLLLGMGDYAQKNHKTIHIYGQEYNQTKYIQTKMLLFVHGLPSHIVEGPTLSKPQLRDDNNKLKKFDIVVSAPPMLSKWKNELDDQYNRYKYGRPPKTYADYAFISHMIATLKDNGRMGVIVPHGTLFRGGKEQEIRKKIIKDNLLDAVIYLPERLLYGATMPVALLIFKKGREKKDKIFFINAMNNKKDNDNEDVEFFFEKGRRQNSLNAQNIRNIKELYEHRKENKKDALLINDKHLSKKEYNLNPGLYFAKNTIENIQNLDDIFKNRQKLIEEFEKINQDIQALQYDIKKIIKK